MGLRLNESVGRGGIEEPDESVAVNVDQEFLQGSYQEQEPGDVDASHKAAEFIIDATVRKPRVKPSTTNGYLAGGAQGNPHNPALDGYDF